MANLRFKKYTHKHTGEPQYDPVDSDGIGGLFQKDIDEVIKSGHTVEIIEDKPRMAASIFNQEDADDDVMMEALDNIQTVFVGGPGSEKRLFGPLMTGMQGETAFEKKLNSLNDRLQQFKENDASLIEAGVKPNDMPAGLQRLDTGMLKGGVPGPYIKHKKGRETRVHLKRDAEGELIPLDIEPTVFGPISSPQKALTSEIVQQKALQLAGFDNVRFNNQRKGLEHYSDHIVDSQDGNPHRIEGKVRISDSKFKDTDNVPSHTYIVPTDGVERDLFDMQKEVRGLIKNKMRVNQIDGITAAELLLQEGKLGISDNQRRLGKLLRSDPTYMKDPQGIYDSMIVTGYPMETMFNDREFNRGRVVKAPSSIHYVPDMKELKDSVTEGSARDVLITRNEGFNDKGDPRTQVQHIIPLNAKRNGKSLYVDMTEEFPMTQQLLDILPYVQRPGK